MLPKEQVFLNIEELSSMISSQLPQQVPHQVPLPPKFNQDILRRSSDFVITRIITGRIGLHSVLLPLLITLFNKVSSVVNSLLELIDLFLLQEICKLTVLILLKFFVNSSPLNAISLGKRFHNELYFFSQVPLAIRLIFIVAQHFPPKIRITTATQGTVHCITKAVGGTADASTQISMVCT